MSPPLRFFFKHLLNFLSEHHLLYRLKIILAALFLLESLIECFLCLHIFLTFTASEMLRSGVVVCSFCAQNAPLSQTTVNRALCSPCWPALNVSWSVSPSLIGDPVSSARPVSWGGL